MKTNTNLKTVTADEGEIRRLIALEITCHEKQFGIIVGHTVLADRMTAELSAHHSAQLQQLGGRVETLEQALLHQIEASELCLGKLDLLLEDSKRMPGTFRANLADSIRQSRALLRPAQEQATKQP